MVLYGRGAASVGEQIGKTREEAQEIIDKFFTAFPKVRKWINETMENAHKVGYVNDIAGRRRRLPDILLDKYTIKDKNTSENDNQNPLLFAKEVFKSKNANNIEKYKQMLAKCKNRKEYEVIKANAQKENIYITDNTGFIAQAERQAVNSRVQGGAATLTKSALISIYNDERLKDIGAKLINTVHDEILMEVPEQTSKQAEELLTENMINSAKKLVPNVPMKTDTYNVTCWYLDEFFVLVESEFKKLLSSGLSDIEAFEKLASERTESTREQLYEIVQGYMTEKPVL